MSDSKKVVNFTAEQTVELVNSYQNAQNAVERKTVVESSAIALGKSVASIRMKLVREGVYVKETPTTKTGEPVQDKENLADLIASFLPEVLDEASVSSLAKSNKKALKLILKTVQELTAFKKAALQEFETVSE